VATRPYVCIQEADWTRSTPTSRPPSARSSKPFLMPVEDVLDQGPGHRGHRPIERGVVQGRRRGRDRRAFRPTRKVVVTGVEMFKKCSTGPGRRQRGLPPARIERGTSAGQVSPRRAPSAHTKFTRPGLRPDQGGGRPPHPLLTTLRPQFYLRTTTCRGHRPPRRRRDDHARDNVEMKVELITPIAIEIGQRFAIREGAEPSAPADRGSIVE